MSDPSESEVDPHTPSVAKLAGIGQDGDEAFIVVRPSDWERVLTPEDFVAAVHAWAAKLRGA